jgi:DNA-binding NtrC family response regulator
VAELNSPDSNLIADLQVLLVEDDEIMRLSLEDRMQLDGLNTRSVATLSEAAHAIEDGDVDLVVTDIRLPDGSGRNILDLAGTRLPGVPVILMTAYGSVAEAVALVQAGASDYLTKPFETTDFIARIKGALTRIAEARMALRFDHLEENGVPGGEGFLGVSPAMRRIEFLIARLATVDSSVLITGESGVGKEMVARLLHDNSQRADGPMVCVNCTAIPETLFESELFGHERGAFTGADRRRIGRFEQAEGGTLFLDEVAEIPPSVQVKLLRALQEREVERLGGDRTIPVDARIVAATQVDLDTAVDEGRFRPDLFWRLNVIHIDVPPLRERQADILHLANRFIAWHAKEMEKTIYGLSAEAESALQNMDFPGNVRELKNLLERAVALAEGRLIEPSLFLPVCAPSAPSNVQTQTTTLKDAVENAERAAILEALQQCHWVIGKTADSLSISRKNLWEKMKRYHINH